MADDTADNARAGRQLVAGVALMGAYLLGGVILVGLAVALMNRGTPVAAYWKDHRHPGPFRWHQPENFVHRYPCIQSQFAL